MMKKTMLVLAALALFSVVTVYAGHLDAVNANDLNNDVTVPKLVEFQRPAPVVVNDREIQGFTTVELLIDEEGKVNSAKILYKPSNLMVTKAINAVSNWTFEPATVDGAPVKAYIAYNVPFGRGLDAFAAEDYEVKLVQPQNMMFALHE